MTHTLLADLEALCSTCPDPQEMIDLLHGLGFDLDFQMDSVSYRSHKQIPALPAQYHLSDRYGTEIIYLAGHDATTDEVRLPEHASRFWLFPGADQAAYHLARSRLSLTWHLTWWPADSHPQQDEYEHRRSA